MLSFSKLYVTIHAIIIGTALVLGIMALQPDSGAEGAWVFFLTVALVTPLHILWTEFRLRRWAKSHDCTLLETRSVWAWKNPFGVSSAMSDNMATYEVKVRDENGRIRRAWVKFGRFWYPSMYVEDVWERLDG